MMYEEHAVYGSKVATSSSKPPQNHDDPKNDDEKDDVPEPATALPGSHVIHSSKCPCENVTRLREGVVLVNEQTRIK